MSKTRVCKKCSKRKKISDFPFRKDSNSYRYECKKCRREWNREYQRQWREKNSDLVASYSKTAREKNPEVFNERKKRWRKENPKKHKAIAKRYRVNNAEKVSERNKKYREKNKDSLREKKKAYVKKRKNKDVGFRLRLALRQRLNKSVVSGSKSGSAVRDLGCSIDKLKIRFEEMFYPHPKTGEEMSWENYGEWHIDHIKPLALFDLTDRKQLKQACHYTNLQPLWAVDNLSKGAT